MLGRLLGFWGKMTMGESARERAGLSAVLGRVVCYYGGIEIVGPGLEAGCVADVPQQGLVQVVIKQPAQWQLDRQSRGRAKASDP